MRYHLDIRHRCLAHSGGVQDILTGVTEGLVRPVIGREMPLSEAAASDRAALEHGVGGKIVLIQQ